MISCDSKAEPALFRYIQFLLFARTPLESGWSAERGGRSDAPIPPTRRFCSSTRFTSDDSFSSSSEESLDDESSLDEDDELSDESLKFFI